MHFDQNNCITPCVYVHLVNWHFVAELVILFTVVHCTYPTMDSSPNNPFSVEWDETKATTETIKWTLGVNGTTKHEIISPILSSLNLVISCLIVSQ
jgi:hypothetical protein